MVMCMGFVALGCAPAKVDPPPAAPMSWASLAMSVPKRSGEKRATAKERGIGDAYLAALGSPGCAALEPLLDEYAKLVFDNASAGAGIDARGRAKVTGAHHALFGAFEQRKLAASRVMYTSDSQLVEWVMTGVHAHAFMGIPATQKPVAINGIALLSTKDDGAITEVHVYFDVLALKAQLGAKHPPLPTLPDAPPQRIELEESTVGRGKSPVRAALDALEEGDEAAYLATMADDVELHTQDRAQPVRGKEQQRTYFRAMRKALGQLDTTVARQWGTGSLVVVEYTLGGEQLAPIGPISFTGYRALQIGVVDVVEIKDGRIARIVRYDNPDAAATL
jgi:ketosteroid isomerase-like protein